MILKRAFENFFKSEFAVGIILLIATVFALLIVNSENYFFYNRFFEINIPLQIQALGIAKDLTLKDWINDALMAVFFLLVGLELKREVLEGELSSKKKMALPAIAALGGVVFPAAIFYLVNQHHEEYLKALSVPCATDIAFAYGLLSFFGKRISTSLKVFLLSLAVLDDLFAILLIAFFYSKNIEISYLIFSALALIPLLALNFYGVKKIFYYLIFGAVLWLMVLKSGVHATFAGVVLAMFIPLRIKNSSPAHDLAVKLTPIVNFLILPVFAFANAGVRINNLSLMTFEDSLVLGIILALFFGKQIGVMLTSFIAVKTKLAHLPKGASWLEFWGAAIFTGIGFTMSLFIGSLVFYNHAEYYDLVKIGVLTGSLLSAVFGFIVTSIAVRKR